MTLKRNKKKQHRIKNCQTFVTDINLSIEQQRVTHSALHNISIPIDRAETLNNTVSESLFTFCWSSHTRLWKDNNTTSVKEPFKI
jgi:hypothetical protein